MITGSSDAGKSAVLRALLWVVQNRPTGDTIRNWSFDKDKEVKVTVEIDGNTISKVRKANRSWYVLNGVKYEAMGSDVPQEIVDVFNLTDINIQTQHTPYFLINDSAGKVAEKLNELVHLDIIDKLFRNINSRVTESKRKINESEELINELTASIDSFKYLDEVSTLLSDIDNEASAVSDREADLEHLQRLLTRIAATESSIAQSTGTISLGARCAAINREIKDYLVKHNEAQELTALVSDAKDQDEKIATEKDWLTVEDRAKELIADIEAWEKMDCEIRLLRKTSASIKEQMELIDADRMSLAALKNQLKSLLKKTTICPVCYQTIGDAVIERIIK